MYCGKHERVLWTTVGGKAGISGWFTKGEDKMPKVKTYLDEKVEALQEFQARKFEWVIEELLKENKSITKWKLLEKAVVKERYINNYLREIDILS